MEDWAVLSGERLSLRELVSKLESSWKCKIQVRWGGKKYRDREVMTPWVGDRLPGWSPKVTIEEGLKEMSP